MANEEATKRSLDFTVPAAEVDQETDRVVQSIRKKVKLPGFRPGKVPSDLIRSRFAADIRKEVLEALIPRLLQERFEKANLTVVGSPDIKDVHFHKGEPLTFVAEVDVLPEFELRDYLDTTITYSEPVVTDEDINQRLEELRERKAEYVNEDPRPVADGDHALISLESRGGLEGDPIQQDELTVEIGGSDSIEDFSTNLRGMEPGQEKEFDVTYPEEYGEARLAGKTVRFHCRLKMVRRKELPELNDEFAKDLGDFQGLDELKEAARSSLRGEREFLAQHEAKNEILEKLVDMHDIPVPESMVERQIEANIQSRMQEMVEQGADPKQLRVDWKKAREVQGERAARDIKARMLLERIADREAVEVTQDEVDREVQRVAKQQQEPVAAVRRKLEEEGHLGRIVNRLRTEKTLNMLFEKSRKTAPEE